ncbi:MAG: hypothetical protein KDA44_05025 [Planctomycetales bacterium]|nr:hypothetical protein [Planctomycetales bacterium]
MRSFLTLRIVPLHSLLLSVVGAVCCVLSASAAPPAPATFEAGGVTWYGDYYAAYRAASEEHRLLLVYLAPSDGSSTAQSIDAAIAARPALQQQLAKFVLCRLPLDATIDVEGQAKRLASFGAFRQLNGGAGFVLIDLAHRNASYYGHAVTALPLASGKYYRWSIDALATALDLPAGTLTQRTMIWAVRMHPERPQSTGGTFNPSLAGGAAQQASYQAQVQQCGHQNFETRFHQLSAAVGSGVTEVCAESWPNQNLIDSCLDCVASWRHSSGHWNGVSRPHRAFAYDIRQGRNGIWYGTGLFAD